MDSDESFSQFYYGLTAVFFTFWSLTWIYFYHTSKGNIHIWGNSAVISNLHSIPVCAFGILSIIGVFPNEYIPLTFSFSFFLVDLADCIIRRDAPFFVHAVISIGLIATATFHPSHPLWQLTSLSKGMLTEASTPFLNRWKATKTKKDFVIFFVMYTLFRIIWVPYFVYEIYDAVGKVDAVCFVSAAYYALQAAWYTRMISMLRNYKDPDKTKSEKDGKTE